jgi:S-adenosylmethionine:tRNA ribosyltransferase-isomerase
MKTRDFFYELPDELIAKKPCEVRSESRLLHYSRATRQIEHLGFQDITRLLNPGDLLVFNNTRVIPARLYGSKSTGGKVEILIERLVSENTALAHVRASKTPKPGSHIAIHGDNNRTYELNITGRSGALFNISSSGIALADIMEHAGHVPLPPYIDREDNPEDITRYQTVYSEVPGAVAAPTAGLHFDQALLDALADRGVKSACVTLHVGAGTFQPVRSENIEDHEMHSEYIEVPQATVDACNEARARGNRIVAVGTTSVRSLETASLSGELAAYQGDSNIFIYPGYEFKSVDALITNFHLPESTLLMLISAFAGKDEMLDCYRSAVQKKYRFFSYGDAMFIE